MTRSQRVGVAVALLMVSAGPVWAKCPDGQVLKKVGTAQNSGTEPEQLVDGPIGIDALSWQCTGTACVVGIYDGDVAYQELQEGDMVLERGAVASGGGFERFDEQLYFGDGVTLFGANISAAVAYTCQPR